MASIDDMYHEICAGKDLPQKLKDWQVVIIDNILHSKSTLGILPTGSGESLCFGLAAQFLDQISDSSYNSYFPGYYSFE